MPAWTRRRKAKFPEEKKKEFEGTPGGYSWISAKDTALLDYEGCEMVLIGAKGEIEGAALPTWLPNPLPSQTIPEHLERHPLRNEILRASRLPRPSFYVPGCMMSHMHSTIACWRLTAFVEEAAEDMVHAATQACIAAAGMRVAVVAGAGSGCACLPAGEVKEHLDAEVAAEVEQAEHEYRGGAEDDAMLEKLRAEIKEDSVPTDPAATGEWK